MGDEWTRDDSKALLEDIKPVLHGLLDVDADALDQALREHHRWDASSPVMDPTAYRELRDANDRAIDVLTAIRDCKHAIETARTDLIEELGDGEFAEVLAFMAEER